MNGSLALGYFQIGLDVVKSKKLMNDSMFNHLKDLAKSFDKAKGIITVEDAMRSLKSSTTEKPKDRDMNNYPRSDNNNKSDIQKKYNNNNWSSGGGHPFLLNHRVNKVYIPLNTDRATILEHMKDKLYFESAKNNTNSSKGNQDK